MPSDLYSLPEANFNSLTESMSTLFQILLGESWNEIMKASMDTGIIIVKIFEWILPLFSQLLFDFSLSLSLLYMFF